MLMGGSLTPIKNRIDSVPFCTSQRFTVRSRRQRCRPLRFPGLTTPGRHPGIAPEDQAKIFEAFSQVGTDLTRKHEGTGLGPTLTRRFVELHGGEMSVVSAVGKGSIFTFTLPVR